MMRNDLDRTDRPQSRLRRFVQNSDVKRFDEILAADFYCSNPDKSLVDRAGVPQADRSAGDDQESRGA